MTAPADHFEDARKALVAGLKAAAPWFASVSEADGCAAFVMTADGQVAGLEYGPAIATADEINLHYLGAIAHDIQRADITARDRIEALEERFLDEAGDALPIVETVLTQLREQMNNPARP